MKTRTRPATGRLDQDDIRTRLVAYGLREEETPLDGYAFTYSTTAKAAVKSFMTHTGGTPPRVFWFDCNLFILSD